MLLGTSSRVDDPAATLTGSKDFINQQTKADSYNWYFRDLKIQLKVKLGLSRSNMALGLAHHAGSTALHFAAREGNVRLVRWLLQNGAHDSLTVKNGMGCTPLEIARRFGPHPEVEAQLGYVMLDKAFAIRFAEWRGGLMLEGTSRVRDSFLGPKKRGPLGANAPSQLVRRRSTADDTSESSPAVCFVSPPQLTRNVKVPSESSTQSKTKTKTKSTVNSTEIRPESRSDGVPSSDEALVPSLSPASMQRRFSSARPKRRSFTTTEDKNSPAMALGAAAAALANIEQEVVRINSQGDSKAALLSARSSQPAIASSFEDVVQRIDDSEARQSARMDALDAQMKRLEVLLEEISKNVSDSVIARGT